MNDQVTAYIASAKHWSSVLEKLREILVDSQLVEEFKWRAPCYTDRGKNIVILGDFKAYGVLSFFKGGLLKDPHNVLQKPGENSREGRIFTFTSVDQVIDNEGIILEYIEEAIEVERKGLQMEEPATDLKLPEDVQRAIDADAALKLAFDALTPGRQRGYQLVFSGAKQSKTRLARLDKYRDRIMAGKGIHDCICGQSKRYPRCDGSHQHIT